jgi:hypothetical protein
VPLGVERVSLRGGCSEAIVELQAPAAALPGVWGVGVLAHCWVLRQHTRVCVSRVVTIIANLDCFGLWVGVCGLGVVVCGWCLRIV